MKPITTTPFLASPWAVPRCLGCSTPSSYGKFVNTKDKGGSRQGTYLPILAEMVCIIYLSFQVTFHNLPYLTLVVRTTMTTLIVANLARDGPSPLEFNQPDRDNI